MGHKTDYSDKSHVSMEMQKCGICTKDFETGSLLLDKRLKPVFNRFTVTGWGTCPECQEKLDQGRIALVVVNREKSTLLPNGNIGLDGAYRTGNVLFIKRDSGIFNPKAPDIPMMFIDEDAAMKIIGLAGISNQEG